MLDNRDGVLQNLISVIPFFILLNYRQRPYLTDSVITNDVGKNYILNSLHTLHPADDMHEYFFRRGEPVCRFPYVRFYSTQVSFYAA